jgi:hypothetical protein
MIENVTNVEFISHGEFSNNVTIKIFGPYEIQEFIIDHNMLEQAWDAYNAQVRAEDSYIDAPYSG